MMTYVDDDQLVSWREHGYAFLPRLVTGEDLDRAQKEVSLLFPSGADFAADRDPSRNDRYRAAPGGRDAGSYQSKGTLSQHAEQFLGLVDFPWTGRSLDRLVVHPAVLGAARELLGDDDIRIYQAQLWAKYTGATSYAQPMHRDFSTHSMLAPDAAIPSQQVEMFLYLHEVSAGLAPTDVVSRRLTADMPAMPRRVWLDERPDLYERAVSFPGPAGSVLVYAPDVWHRGVDLTEPKGARIWANLSYKIAGCDWLGLQSFVRTGLSTQWSDFVGSCTVDELLVFGFPPPGDPSYTCRVLEGMHLRYPGLDLGPWEDALSGCRATHDVTTKRRSSA